MMKQKLQEIREEAVKQIQNSDALDKLNDVRVAFLGKKGKLTAVLKGMKDVAAEERPMVGQMVNETRAAIEGILEETKQRLEAKAREEQLKREVIDVTLPAKKNNLGHRHPNTIALEEVERIFIGMGYEVVEGPEVEYDLYNFEKLNIPANHPAKDENIGRQAFCRSAQHFSFGHTVAYSLCRHSRFSNVLTEWYIYCFRFQLNAFMCMQAVKFS